MTFFPGLIPTFPSQTNKVDVADAVLINTMTGEINAIAAELGTNPAGDQTDVTTRLAKMISDSGALKQGAAFPGTTEPGLLFFRTDEDKAYIRNAADDAWDVIGALLDYDNGTSYNEASGVTERSTSSLTSVKLKEFSPVLRDGNVTIQFEAKSTSAGQVTVCQLYIDGGAEGPTSYVVAGAYGTVFEYANVSVKAGEQVQIYGYRDAAQAATLFVKNAYIKCENPSTPQETTGY